MRPVQVLSELATSLEAAVLECLSKPRKKAVHGIRTSTRRIEAQLELLSMLDGLPPHGREILKVRKLLKKLRGAAGAVRDLDVQRTLIKDEIAGNRRNRALEKEGKRLRAELKRVREREAEKLVGLLERDERKLPRTLGALLAALEPAAETRITEARMVALIREWYRRHAEPSVEGAEAGETDQLHAVRKVAKLARYLGETVPESATAARRLAAKFESMQEAGGHWHDWMQLAGVAVDELGRSAALPQRFTEHADSALSDYQRRLRYRM
ncbi:MAG: hypothetical protein NVSMB62_07030 [Acidobacteriaceae bacterium]